MTTRDRSSTPPGALAGGDVEGIGPLYLEDLVDRDALRELAASFEALFGISVRILSSRGRLLGEAASERPLCALVNETEGGHRGCAATLDDVKSASPAAGCAAIHRCFTGARYRVEPLEYDKRAVGRIVLGPYVAEPRDEPPGSLLAIDAALDEARAREGFASMPRADEATIDRLAVHLRAVLDLILFSGHKAHLTSKMHVLAVEESYRELQEKNERLATAYERLKELDRLKSNFLASVSHELRTPLTSIMGYGEMLAEGMAGPLSAEQAEFVGTIRTKSDQLLGLIMSLLDLSKLESGTMTVQRRAVSIDEVLGEAVSTLAPLAAKKGVELHAAPHGELAPLEGDPDRLRQVFINLAENAIKFTPPGGEVRLEASERDDADETEGGLVLVAPLRRVLEVRVVDTGVGVPEAERGRVFDAFYQVDQSSTREHGGAGLGLSIVKRLVEAHGGSIRVEANEPRGAVFVVKLPLPRQAQAAVHDTVPPVFSLS
jgi:signal transduction histidine kinase